MLIVVTIIATVWHLSSVIFLYKTIIRSSAMYFEVPAWGNFEVQSGCIGRNRCQQSR